MEIALISLLTIIIIVLIFYLFDYLRLSGISIQQDLKNIAYNIENRFRY